MAKLIAYRLFRDVRMQFFFEHALLTVEGDKLLFSASVSIDIFPLISFNTSAGQRVLTVRIIFEYTIRGVPF